MANGTAYLVTKNREPQQVIGKTQIAIATADYLETMIPNCCLTKTAIGIDFAENFKRTEIV